MTVDLSDDEIGLIQEAIYTKLQKLKEFQIADEDRKEIMAYETLLDKTVLWQEILMKNEEE